MFGRTDEIERLVQVVTEINAKLYGMDTVLRTLGDDLGTRLDRLEGVLTNGHKIVEVPQAEISFTDAPVPDGRPEPEPEPKSQRPPVTDQSAAAVAWRLKRLEEARKKPVVRDRPKGPYNYDTTNHRRGWVAEEAMELALDFLEGVSIATLARRAKRRESGVYQLLLKEGLLARKRRMLSSSTRWTIGMEQFINVKANKGWTNEKIGEAMVPKRSRGAVYDRIWLMKKEGRWEHVGPGA